MGTLQVFTVGILFAAFIASIDTASSSDCIVRSRLTGVAKRTPSDRRKEGESGDSSSEDRSDAYKFMTTKWLRTNLTYKILKYSRRLSESVVDDVIRRSFKMWTDVSNLTIEALPRGSNKRADIEITFVPKIAPNVLGISGGPYCNDPIEISDDYRWVVDTYGGRNLRETAAHEIGHALGLDHSDDHGALMCPGRRRGIPNFTLGSDDIKGIQALYGAPSGKKKSSSPNEPSQNGSSGRGATSSGRGTASSGRGATSSGRGATPSGRGATPSGRGATPSGRGRSSLGRGGSSGRIPESSSSSSSSSSSDSSSSDSSSSDSSSSSSSSTDTSSTDSSSTDDPSTDSSSTDDPSSDSSSSDSSSSDSS